MADNDQTATVTYTTNPLLSPGVIGLFVTLAASIASASGVHVLDNPAIQQQLVVAIGIVGTAIAHWMWPHNDGKLSFAAPLSTPAPQVLPTGTSVVTVAKPDDTTKVTDVKPLPLGEHIVSVKVAPLASTPKVTVSPS